MHKTIGAVLLWIHSLEAGSSFAEVDQNVSMESFLGLEPYVLKVHFWDVNDDNGNNTAPLTTIQMLDQVARLNKDFNTFNIFFKFDGMTSFNEEQFQDINMDANKYDFMNYQDDNDLYFAGTINIYSVKDITNNDDQNIGAYYQSGNFGKFGTIVSRDYIIGNNSFHITHELGHFFRLDHTFACRADPTNEEGYICENVTRDPNAEDENGESIYNADTAGDKIIDTFATPTYYLNDNCVYIDDLEDSTGTPYSLYPPQAKNFMGYINGCQEEFTPGQVAIMRHYINFYDNDEAITVIEKYPVSILYEPYQGEYYLAGASTSHNPPLFQYGFDYVFYDTSQADVYNQPSTYNDTSFWYGSVTQSYDVDYNTPIIHQNHTAFKILQLDANYPRMCYNNYNRAPTGGTVIKFLDGVPNTNVVISSQDSLQINNTNLIEELEPGLYNVIKSYNDGETQETMIFKENN